MTKRVRFGRICAFALALTLLLALPGAALAQGARDYNEPEPPGIGGEIIDRPDVNPGTDTTGTDGDVAPGTLPFTGADLVLWTTIGLGAIGAGLVIIRVARRSEA
jgi:hypothetical protein